MGRMGGMSMSYDRLNLESIAAECGRVYDRCAADNMNLFGGSLLDLLADNLPDVPLRTLVDAIVVSGIAGRCNGRVLDMIKRYERTYRNF